jgi:photosystem II stability/assembly factor-like uncharacterized protein
MVTPTEVRFANTQDGWIIGWTGGHAPISLWETHDGGAHWEMADLPSGQPNQGVIEVAASTGTVVATFCNMPRHILTSPVRVDDWTIAPTTLGVSAGPDCTTTIVLQGASGWILDSDRGVQKSARLDDGAWVPWTPTIDCRGSASASLAASDATHLVLVCDAGEWFSGPPRTVVSFSDDGGASFQPSSNVLPPATYGMDASPAPGVAVIATKYGLRGLIATFNGGTTWTNVYPLTTNGGCSYVGFTTATQGVAICSPNGTMLMTFDGGHTWNPVSFPTVKT